MSQNESEQSIVTIRIIVTITKTKEHLTHNYSSYFVSVSLHTSCRSELLYATPLTKSFAHGAAVTVKHCQH